MKTHMHRCETCSAFVYYEDQILCAKCEAKAQATDLLHRIARKTFYVAGIYDTVGVKTHNDVLKYLESQGLVEITRIEDKRMWGRDR
jgi:hypothetical protein